MRTYIAIPVTTSTAFTITVSYKQTSSLTGTVGKVALVGSDGIVLAEKDAGSGTAAATGDTITYTSAAGHALTSVWIFYGRENDTSKSGAASGGVSITEIDRVQ